MARVSSQPVVRLWTFNMECLLSASVGIRIATTAHNQLLHSLSSAGLIGAVGLIFYATMMIIYALTGCATF